MSENEVQIWDHMDGPPLPDNIAPSSPHDAPMELDEPQAMVTPRDPTPTPRASSRRRSWSPRHPSPSSTRRPRSPDWYARLVTVPTLRQEAERTSEDAEKPTTVEGEWTAMYQSTPLGNEHFGITVGAHYATSVRAELSQCFRR